MKRVMLLLTLFFILATLSCEKSSGAKHQEEIQMNPVEPPPPEGTCATGHELCGNCAKHYTGSACPDCAVCQTTNPICHKLTSWPEACKEYKPKTNESKANTSVGFPDTN